MADDVDDGQVDDGPVGSRRRLLRDARPPPNERLIRLRRPWGSLEFPQPGVGDDGSQDGREVTQAAEGVVDGRGQVLVPFQVGEEVERQHRCEGDTRGQAVTQAGAPSDAYQTYPGGCLQKSELKDGSETLNRQNSEGEMRDRPLSVGTDAKWTVRDRWAAEETEYSGHKELNGLLNQIEGL